MLRAAFSILVLLIALIAHATPSQAAGPKRIITGILSAGAESPTAFERVKASGAHHVRKLLIWPAIAPKDEPSRWDPENPLDTNYRWEAIDAWVNNVVAKRLTPFLQFYGAPSWAQRCDVPETYKSTGPPCNPDPEKMVDFVTAAVRRYSGAYPGIPRVKYWQIQNEPNLSFYFLPQFGKRGQPISPGIYRELLNRSYDAIKAVNKTNVVLSAGLAPIGRPRVTVHPMEFARRFLCMKGRKKPKPVPRACPGGVKFDIFDIHPYTTGAPTHKSRHPDDVQMGDMEKLINLVRAAERAGKVRGMYKRTPFWITEMSWDSNPPDPGGVPFSILKRWTSEAIYRAWKAGIDHFFWLLLRDPAPSDRPFRETIESGLYFRGETIEEDRPKPSLQAFRFPFVAFSNKREVTFWGRTPTSTNGRVTLQVRQGGRWRRASIAKANRFGVFQGSLKVSRRLRPNRGQMRALYRQEYSLPFSLRKVKDFYQPPFG